jgi:hypothetical protein
MLAADVAVGSLAAAAAEICGVRFTPESCRGCRRPARQLRADAVEKGKNEPIEIFARALVKIDSS